jgi:hypothetical protein
MLPDGVGVTTGGGVVTHCPLTHTCGGGPGCAADWLHADAVKRAKMLSMATLAAARGRIIGISSQENGVGCGTRRHD